MGVVAAANFLEPLALAIKQRMVEAGGAALLPRVLHAG